LKNGLGKYYYLNGISYEGQWKEDKILGYGSYILKNGDKNIGEFGYDLRNGF